MDFKLFGYHLGKERDPLAQKRVLAGQSQLLPRPSPKHLRPKFGIWMGNLQADVCCLAALLGKEGGRLASTQGGAGVGRVCLVTASLFGTASFTFTFIEAPTFSLGTVSIHSEADLTATEMI